MTKHPNHDHLHSVSHDASKQKEKLTEMAQSFPLTFTVSNIVSTLEFQRNTAMEAIILFAKTRKHEAQCDTCKQGLQGLLACSEHKILAEAVSHAMGHALALLDKTSPKTEEKEKP